jgi:hypothetical protein
LGANIDMTTIASGAPARVHVGSFYAWMAAACVATAFLGFIPTYWQPLAAGKFAANPVVHMHGFFMFSWTLFALAQTSLVPAGRVALHRQVGLAGISLATVITMMGLLAALNSERNAAAVAGGAQAAEAFLIVPLSIIATFAVLFVCAVANIRRPEIHKRFMLLATISVLNAPVARPLLTWVFTEQAPGGTPPVWINVPACYLSYLLILPAMYFDWRTRGRVHPIYLVALPVLLFVAWVVIPISETAAWHNFARFYLTLAGTTSSSPH